MNKYKNRRRKKSVKPIVFVIILCLVTFLLLFINGINQRPKNNGGNDIDLMPNQSVMAQTPDGRIVVALDAGHGGSDGGADEYIVEKDMTETTVQYLQELLQQDENYRVVLCREYGEGASIDERCSVANDANVSLLLSIHGNTDPTRTATGFECFAAPPGRTYHEKSLAAAKIIARKMGEAGQRMRGENGVRYKYYEELANGKTKEIIAEESVTEVNSAKSFGILERTNAPAVLAEQCFLTSKSDVDTWASETGCKKAAQIYYEAICEFFNTEPVIIT